MSQPTEQVTRPSAGDFVHEAGYFLHLTRALEEAGRRLYLQGRLPGSFYDGRGQEATAVGAALAMGPRDVACPLIRDMGVHLVRGVSAEELLRHYLGKTGAPMEGRDGNIHLGALDRGTLPMISHLPEMLPVGMGLAVARGKQGEPSAALCFCGDGASAGGVFHETLNLAALWCAPLVVVIERNHFAYMTPEAVYLPIERLSSRAAGYGIESATVDGNDVFAVHELVRTALDRARSDAGPMLIEAFTYRMHGHGAHDAQRYVPPEELELWATRDPLARWQEQADRDHGWTEADHQALETQVAGEVAAGLEAALAADYPDPAGLAASVFA